MSSSDGKRRPLAAGLILLVVATFVIASAIELVASRDDVAQWTAERAAVVEQVMQEALDGVVADVEAVAAFVEEIDPTPQQFESYAARLEVTESAIGIGYLTAVPAAEVDEFLAAQSAIHGDWFEIWEFQPGRSASTPVDLTSRSTFYPVQAFAVGQVIQGLIGGAESLSELGVGLDAGYEPAWRADIATAIQENSPSLSSFIEINIETSNMVLRLDQVFFATAPVRNADGTNRGLVMAMLQEELLVNGLSTPALENIEWEIVPADANPARVTSEYVEVFPVELPGTIWSVAIAPTAAAADDLQGLPWWLTAAAAATLVFFAALALWLFVDRRREHKRMTRFRQIADDKDRFLASVSHELRTPLTVVSGLAYELHEEPDNFTAAERQTLLGMLVEQTDELTGIVEDLLIAARSDIGKVTIHYEEINLGEEAKRAVETSGVSGSIVGRPTTAYADAQRVRQILRNLLTNAKRYGGPKVRIEFAEGTDWTEIVVADNGDGVPRAKREAIFESYESAHEPVTAVRSVGLGLYISRNLARAMGGDLEYVYDGTWSRFRLRLRTVNGWHLEQALRDEAKPAPKPEASNVA